MHVGLADPRPRGGWHKRPTHPSPLSPRVPFRLLVVQSDERLVKLVRDGHERAFDALVHRYRRPLLRYCRSIGLSESRAEDVLQLAMLNAWLALTGGVEVRELKPWLYRI